MGGEVAGSSPAAARHRNGLSRGVLLVKADGGKPVVVGRDAKRG